MLLVLAFGTRKARLSTYCTSGMRRIWSFRFSYLRSRIEQVFTFRFTALLLLYLLS